MRYRWMRRALVLATGLFLGVAPAKAQSPFGQTTMGTSSLNNYDFPNQPANPLPLPIGPERAGQGGFYAAMEAVVMKQDRALGNQILAIRGFVDSLGTFTGAPGTFVGSGAVALESGQMGRSSYQPGYELTFGYKFESGFSLSVSYLQLMEQTYNAGASGAGNPQNPGALNQNTFLYSGVYNYTNYFAGPQIRTFDDLFSSQFTPGGTTGGYPIVGRVYGIWNGASYETESYLQRFTAADITGRMPVFETDYSRTYGLAGARFAWFFERFTWRTTAVDVNGNADGTDSATYTNTLSQRMYGAFVGCGNEIYLGSNFALSLDATASLLLDVALERPKYERDDGFTESKNSRDDYTFVPNINLKPSLWWYPTKGVQIRLSYVAEAYFNTIEMNNPVGFNFGDIDPGYTHRVMRLVQGLEVGIGISF